MPDSRKEIRAWREVRESERYLNAFRGLRVYWKTTRNLRVHIPAGVLAVLLGFLFKISAGEWLAVVFAIGLVLSAEAMNTAIEIDVDLTSPEYHPFARDTKDVAAAAVLITAFTALAVGLTVFLPKVLNLL